MPDLPLHWVDVFAEAPLAGNPLAVVLGAGALDGETMQRIARETNLSETTFVLGSEGGAQRVRIFTPTFELPFAGHPTLGTAWVIRRQLARAPETVRLALGVGEVPVSFESGEDGIERAWLTAPAVALAERFDAKEIAPLLGLAEPDLADDAAPQIVDAGIRMLLVPLSGTSALARARLDLDAFVPLAERHRLPAGAYLVARSPGDADLEVRLFFDSAGLREDPATGSAAACLGAWLLEHRWLGAGPLALTLSQGERIGRPSRLHLRASKTEAGREIRVGGRVLPVIEGRVRVPS